MVTQHGGMDLTLQLRALAEQARNQGDAPPIGPHDAVLLDRPVHLYLHVKVKPGWDEDRGVYRDIGLDWVD